MKPLLVVAFFCLSAVCAIAQEHFVVSSSGGVFSSPSGTLEWTLGEISTETYEKNFGFLTQGFHQTFVEESSSLNGITVYPVPAQDFLFIQTSVTGTCQIEIFNLQGVRMRTGQVSSDPTNNIHSVDIQNLGAALYQLRVRNMTTGKSSAFKIILL